MYLVNYDVIGVTLPFQRVINMLRHTTVIIIIPMERFLDCIETSILPAVTTIQYNWPTVRLLCVWSCEISSLVHVYSARLTFLRKECGQTDGHMAYWLVFYRLSCFHILCTVLCTYILLLLILLDALIYFID